MDGSVHRQQGPVRARDRRQARGALHRPAHAAAGRPRRAASTTRRSSAPAERAELITGFNDTAGEFPSEMTLHGLVEAQAARTPDAVAVTFEGARLTYRELDARAERGRASPVRARRRAGDAGRAAAPSGRRTGGRAARRPQGRRRLPAAGPGLPGRAAGLHARGRRRAVVLTQEGLRAQVPPTSARCSRSTTWAAAPAPPAGWRAQAGDLAYVIYTSGSTGRPKGVVNTIAGSSTGCSGCSARYRLDAGRPRAAEDAVQLRRVGVGVLLAAAGRRQPGAGAARRAQGPGLPARPDPSAGRDHRCTSCRRCCGLFLDADAVEAADRAEPAPGHLQRRGAARPTGAPAVLQALPAELHNLYGPTEAAVDVTRLAVHAEALAGAGADRPARSGTLRLLRARRALRPVPVGVPGELYLGGVRAGARLPAAARS